MTYKVHKCYNCSLFTRDEIVLLDNRTEAKYLNKGDYISFSLASFASSAVNGLAQGYLLIFYTAILDINPKATALMFLIAKIWDGINDPIMGVIVDKTRTRWGKMRPYLILGAIPFGIIAISLFLPVNFSYNGRVIYMYITYFAYGIIATIVGVPLGGLSAVVSPNTQERTKIISISRILGSIGEQSALVLISVLLIVTGKKMGLSYMLTAMIIGCIAPVFMIISGIRLKERIEPSSETPNILDGFKYLFKNKPFLLMIFSNLLTFFRNLVSAAIIYVVTYIYCNGSLQIWFALPGAIASMLGMLFAPALKKRMEAKQLFILATIWHSIGLAVVFLIGYQVHWSVTAAFMFIAMLPVGILNVVPTLMAADTLDYWEHKTGERREGVTFSLMGLRSKVASGFKDFVLSYLLIFVGFSKMGTGELMPGTDTYFQTPETQKGLFMIFTIIPAITNLISILPMMFYNLQGERLQEIRLELEKRRNTKEVDKNIEM